MTTTFVLVSAIAIANVATAGVLDPQLEADTIEALINALAAHHINDKEACLLLRYSAAQWSEIKSRKLRAPSLTRLTNLPLPVLHDFIPEFMKILVRYKFTGLIESQKRSA